MCYFKLAVFISSFLLKCAHLKTIICSFLFLWYIGIYYIKANHDNSIQYDIIRVALFNVFVRGYDFVSFPGVV